MDPKTNPHCYVCNSRAGVSIRNAVEIFNSQNKFPTTDRSLVGCMNGVLDQNIDKQNVHSFIICKKCYKLFQEYDELDFRMNEIKDEVKKEFRRTLQRHDLNSDAGSDRVADNSYLKKDGVKIKEEIHTTDDSNSMEWSKTPTFSDIKKISPAPSNLIIVGHKGKKITIPKSDIKAPTQKNNFDITNVKKEKSTHLSDDSDENQAQVLDPIESELEKMERSPSEVENKNEESHEKKCSEGKKVIEYLSEVDGIIVKTEGVDRGDDDKYVISELEIVENGVSDMQLEDGTILNTNDGSIIKVLQHEGKSIIQDEEGNFYRTNEDGNLEMILQEDDDCDVDLDEDVLQYETINLKEGVSILKFNPSILNRNMFKSKKSNGLDDEDSKDEENMLHGRVIYYSCLACGSTDMEKKHQESGEIFEADANKDEEEKIFLGDANMIMEHMKTVHNMKIYICEICGYVKTTKASILEHLATDHMAAKNGEFKCEVCLKTFDTRLSLKKHEKFQHWKAKYFACNTCNKKFSSKTLLEEHTNIHKGLKPYNCERCGKYFTSKYTHQSHMKTHMERPRPYTCSKCGKSFFTLQNLNQHEKTHLGIKDFVCKICNKAFGTMHNLEVHGVVHTGVKPFKCKTCGKGFARRAEIRDHERTHTGERPYVCDICGTSFSQRSNLQSHKRATHFDDKRYKCRMCEKCFKRRRLLEYHIKASHTGERPFRCQVCDATFVYPEHFKKHQRIHSGEKPYKCEVCQKAFNSRDNRNAHRFVHSDKKPYECLVCGAGFMRKPMLYAHMHTMGHLRDTIVVNQPRLNCEGDSGENRNTFIIENGQEEVIPKFKEECPENDIVEIPVLVQTADQSQDGSMIAKTEEIMPNEETYLESTEDVMDEDMLDPQRIEIIDDETTHEVSEFIQTEDGTLRLVQIRLSDGENAWVALND